MDKIPGRYFILGALAFSSFAFAQDQDGGWRRLGESHPYAANPATAPQNAPPERVPSSLTIKPGTYVTVRINQPLSSDRNQPGDAFSATLVEPLVVDGVVVSERGQTVAGRVTDAEKAGRVKGVSKLGVQLIDLPVVDGQQMPIQTQLVTRTGPTSEGRDATAIGATTVAGTAIGAGIQGAGGAAVGAGAGLLVGVVGVMLTRGHPTVIYPESVLTFQIEQPVTISTEHAQYAFRYVQPADYQQSAAPRMQQRGPAPGPGYRPPPPAYPYAYPYPYYGGYYGYGYGFGYPYYGGFWGPSVVIGFHGHGRRW